MSDLSAEPSMEDILSSIKRIIAEEGEPANPRPLRRSRPAARPLDEDEVLELSEPVGTAPAPRTEEPAPEDFSTREETRMSLPDASPSSPRRPAQAAEPARWDAPEPIVSRAAVEASRGALDQLSRMVVKPETPGAETLEGLVREMLRPMLREWLDAHLPQIVEAAVEREVARISGRPS